MRAPDGRGNAPVNLFSHARGFAGPQRPHGGGAERRHAVLDRPSRSGQGADRAEPPGHGPALLRVPAARPLHEHHRLRGHPHHRQAGGPLRHHLDPQARAQGARHDGDPLASPAPVGDRPDPRHRRPQRPAPRAAEDGALPAVAGAAGERQAAGAPEEGAASQRRARVPERAGRRASRPIRRRRATGRSSTGWPRLGVGPGLRPSEAGLGARRARRVARGRRERGGRAARAHPRPSCCSARRPTAAGCGSTADVGNYGTDYDLACRRRPRGPRGQHAGRGRLRHRDHRRRRCASERRQPLPAGLPTG